MTTIPVQTALTPIVEGKTKKVFLSNVETNTALIVSKDDITAGDGAKHDILTGKAAFATRTTCNVFRLLKECGVPVAFDEQVDVVSFSAPLCKMLPYEVVVRREGHGSYLKRTPGLPKGHYFPKLVLEFFLKTSGKKWKETDLPCDDPLINFVWDDEGKVVRDIQLFHPAKPIASQEPFIVFGRGDVFTEKNEPVLVKAMGVEAKRVFLILEKAWQLLGRTLVDFKVEFGVDKDGNLLLADVIDNDSWRVLENGAYIDKQVYRDGGKLDEVIAKYAHVAVLTDQFKLPAQRIIMWAGSETDDLSGLEDTLEKNHWIHRDKIICSVHKEPVRAIAELYRLVQEVPDAVIIAVIGRSNGAGPTLSAAVTVPVITVPATSKDFREDVWSSLRSPSDVPVMTVLEQSNAALAALNILSARNPQLYATLRGKLETRLVNTVPM